MTYSPIDKPDYARSQAAAYETVLKSNQKGLPLSIKKIIKSTPNLHIQKYSTFAKKRKLTFEEVIELLDSEEGCLWMRSDGQYIILYNDKIENTGRIRFTLAHELGHFILKHNEKSKRTRLSRYSLTNEEYDVFEKEANYFAKRLLAPIPLVDLYVANWKKIYASSVEFAFDTSFTVANYIIADLNRRYKISNIMREGHPMVINFIDFINLDANSKICTVCHSLQHSKNLHCSICGSIDAFVFSTASTYSNYFIERKKTMFYSTYILNENFRAKVCPRCNNQNLLGTENACQICGTNIMNRCLGDPWELPLSNFNTISLPNGCAKGRLGLSGDARFCPHCGGTTTFAYQGLLSDWKEEYQSSPSIMFNGISEPSSNTNLSLLKNSE